MIILGIDPGLQKTGWGLIESQGSSLKFIACGLVKTDTSQMLSHRLRQIDEGISDVLRRHSPSHAAIEETFVNKNPASALKLGMARGVAMAVPARFGLDVAEYAANLVKKSLVGVGHAEKNQMGMMIRILLPSCRDAGPDEADALAVAICHAHHVASPHYSARMKA